MYLALSGLLVVGQRLQGLMQQRLRCRISRIDCGGCRFEKGDADVLRVFEAFLGQNAFVAGDLILRECEIADPRSGRRIGAADAENNDGLGSEPTQHERGCMGRIDLAHAADAQKNALVAEHSLDQLL
jgi:hypothetical protein